MQILTKFIEVEFPPGYNINDAIYDAKCFAKDTRIPVEFSFNGVKINISVNCKFLSEEIADMYYKELNRERRVDV